MAAFNRRVQAGGAWDMSGEGEEPEVMTAEVDPSSMSGISERENSELPMDMAEWTQEELEAYNNLRSKRKKCCVGGCTHRSIPIARSYHQLPVRNKEIWAKWIEVIRWSRNDPEWAPHGEAAPLVCSRHFPDSDFISYEASSRVRLSHTALPIYFIDPPEGTVMDPRFSSPLPIPPIAPGGPKKETYKTKHMKFEDDHQSPGAGARFEPTYAIKPAQYADNYGYDIEEVNDNEDMYEEEEQTSAENYTSRFSNDQAINYSVSAVTTTNRQSRLSCPPTLQSFQRKNPVINNTPRPKMPALIKANFQSFQPSSSQPKPKPNPLGGNVKTIMKKNIQHVMPISNHQQHQSAPTKHKIGIAKCRLIVQTLETQLKIAKMRLAEQLDIPLQVVQGVWNMKDSLKDKL